MLSSDPEPQIIIDEESYEIKAIREYIAGKMKLADLQASLGLSRAWTARLVARFKKDGPAGLQSRKLGKANNATPANLRKAALAIVRESYADFGPKLASEKLAELHNIRVLSETLRKWMKADGLWTGPPGNQGYSALALPALDEANWCRSTAHIIAGSRSAVRKRACWFLSTTRPASSSC